MTDVTTLLDGDAGDLAGGYLFGWLPGTPAAMFKVAITDLSGGSGGSGAPSVRNITSSATVTPTFIDDQVNITAQTVSLTLANPIGTAVPGWGLVVRIKDDGTSRAISYGTQYRAIGVTLPTATSAGKTLYLGLIYNAADTKWDVVAVAQEV